MSGCVLGMNLFQPVSKYCSETRLFQFRKPVKPQSRCFVTVSSYKQEHFQSIASAQTYMASRCTGRRQQQERAGVNMRMTFKFILK
jgi:hypothetical protein